MKNTTIKTLETLENIVINGDIFIIPNRACKIDDYYEDFREKFLKEAIEICEINGFEFNKDEDHIIETWYLSNELGCDNIPDHDLYIVYDNKEYQIISTCGRQIPENFFRGHKEGDVVSVKLPCIIRESHLPHHKGNVDGDIETVVEFRLKLNQGDYRYRRFGEFEDVLRKVCM